MKTVLLILLALAGSFASAQDSLQLQKGPIIPVTITSIDHQLGLLKYSANGSNHSVSLNTVARYYYQDQWTENSVKVVEYFPEIVTELRWYDNYFSKNIVFEMSRWSVATNVLAPFTGSQSNNSYFSSHYDGYQTAPIITIEPEYRINDHVAVKLNAQFAFDGIKQPESLSLSGWRAQRYSYNYSYFKTWGRAIYNLEPWYSPSTHPDYSRHIYSNKDEFPHLPNVVFQVGVYPKYYVQSQRKRAFYFSAGANVGLADFLAVDYYHSFTVRENHPTLAKVKWSMEKQVIKTQPNRFVFLRFEALAGMNFNIARQLAIGLEGGVSTRINNKGSEKDNIYVQVNEGDFKLVDSLNYEVEKSLIAPTFKLLLIYRFGR